MPQYCIFRLVAVAHWAPVFGARVKVDIVEESSTTCAAYCERNARAWSHKCGWTDCTGCADCQLPPSPSGTSMCADVWQSDWGSTPSSRCTEWLLDSNWGARKDGQSVDQACSTAFAKENCAATCGCQGNLPLPWEFIFCRHGESMNNVLMHGDVSRAFQEYGVQSLSQDSPLTETGKEQATAAHALMAENTTDNIQLPMLRLTTSSLIRAKQTAEIIFREISELQNLPGSPPQPDIDPRLNEQTPYEKIVFSQFEDRIKDFVQAMLRRPEEERPQAVVGHSLWYKLLTRMDRKIPNCACRKVTISPARTNDGRGFEALEYPLIEPRPAAKATTTEPSTKPVTKTTTVVATTTSMATTIEVTEAPEATTETTEVTTDIGETKSTAVSIARPPTGRIANPGPTEIHAPEALQIPTSEAPTRPPREALQGHTESPGESTNSPNSGSFKSQLSGCAFVVASILSGALFM